MLPINVKNIVVSLLVWKIVLMIKFIVKTNFFNSKYDKITSINLHVFYKGQRQ